MSGWTRTPDHLRVCIGLLLLGCACATTNVGPARDSLYNETVPLAEGGRLHLAEYRNQVLMVDFFTTWAPACLLTIPEYSALFRKYKDRGLAVVGISLDELGAKVVRPFALSLEIPYPLALANQEILEGRSSFGNIAAAPLLMIFDRNGELVKIFVGRVPIEEIEAVILSVLR